MPNVHIKKSDLKPFPFKCGEFEYRFVAKSKHNKLIYVRREEENFFLEMIDKKDSFLLKADKITKPTNIKIVQDSMKAFVVANKLSVLHSNIDSSRNHLAKKSPFQKDIFFYKDYKYDCDLEVEIGFGSGRHLLYQAKKNPNKKYIGIEIHKPSIEQLLKQCELQNITNIAIVDFDSRIVLQMLPSNVVNKIYLHFPVPWDKKPHRRVMSKTFIDEVVRVLKKDGRLELRTDSENYFKYSRDILLSLNESEILIKKNINIEISSKYEDRWIKMDKNIYDIIFINKTISEEKKEYILEDFKERVDFLRLYNKFENHTIKKDDYFVHFENIYKIDNTSGIIKLSFGAYGKNEHKYLLISDTVRYLPTKTLPTKQNVLSDKIVKEYIYE